MNPIYRRTCLLLSLLFFSSQFFSQKNEIDSLKGALILNSRLDTNRINTLYRLAFASFQKDENITKAYLKEVTYLSDSLNYPLGKAKQYYLGFTEKVNNLLLLAKIWVLNCLLSF